MSDKLKMRVIGDVHGCINTYHPTKDTRYTDIIRGCDYSVQLGDMGFNYSGLNAVGLNHQFIPGNHDNYDALPAAHALDSFGNVALGPFAFFYVRGAWSIDVQRRRQLMAAGNPRMWWPNEQLSLPEMEQCVKDYEEAKPDVVMTHSCPLHISEQVGSPNVWQAFGWSKPQYSNTQRLLEEMYQIHEPKLWLFGHFHRNRILMSGKTKFICVDELSYFDFNEQWEIV